MRCSAVILTADGLLLRCRYFTTHPGRPHKARLSYDDGGWAAVKDWTFDAPEYVDATALRPMASEERAIAPLLSVPDEAPVRSPAPVRYTLPPRDDAFLRPTQGTSKRSHHALAPGSWIPFATCDWEHLADEDYPQDEDAAALNMAAWLASAPLPRRIPRIGKDGSLRVRTKRGTDFVQADRLLGYAGQNRLWPE